MIAKIGIRHTLAFLLPLVLLTGCAGDEETPLTFRYHLAAAPDNLDPAHIETIYSAGVADRIFDGLLRFDRVHGVPVPEIALSYTVSADGLSYEFKLDPKARFHNGRPILASDFKYSWERLLAPKTGSPDAWLLELIEGAASFQAGTADSVGGIDATGSHLLRVKLNQPFAPFLLHLSLPETSVVPQEDVKRLGADFTRQPVGSGPYRFVSWPEPGLIELEAFDDHPTHQPQVRRLIFEAVPDGGEALRRYQAGELDLVSQVPTGSFRSLQQAYAADLQLLPAVAWYGFCFRCDQAPFDDRMVRRAFSLAVDRAALTQELGELQYSGLAGFLPETIPGHDPAEVDRHHAPSHARKLLAEAGYPEGSGFPKQVYVTREGELNRRVVDRVIAALADLGLTVEPSQIDNSTLTAGFLQGQLALFRFGWTGDYPDPEAYLRASFRSGAPSNLSAYSNPMVDELLDAARAEQHPPTRLALYRQAEALIVEDAPCVALYQMTEAILLKPRWQGIPIGYLSQALEIERAELSNTHGASQ